MLSNTINTNDIISYILLINILKYLVIITVAGFALYLIIRATCRYQAKKISESFNYDLLAVKTAQEVYKRMLLIEERRAKENKDAANQ